MFLDLKTLAVTFKNSAENIANDEYTKLSFRLRAFKAFAAGSIIERNQCGG